MSTETEDPRQVGYPVENPNLEWPKKPARASLASAGMSTETEALREILRIATGIESGPEAKNVQIADIARASLARALATPGTPTKRHDARKVAP